MDHPLRGLMEGFVIALLAVLFIYWGIAVWLDWRDWRRKK